MAYAPDTALAGLEQQIRDAWLTVRPDRRSEALKLKAWGSGFPISVDIAGGSDGDPFACEPGLGLIHMKWWALEVLWIAAYAFQSLAPRLANAAKGGTRETYLEESEHLESARNLLALACKSIEQKESQIWPEDLPHPSKRAGDCRDATDIFLAALGWIHQHEVAHIIVDRALFESSSNPSITEERYCDNYATRWLLTGGAPTSSAIEKGIVVAVFFIGLRELLQGHNSKDHPDAAERIRAAVSEEMADRYAYWLALLVDVLLQSGKHETPASRQYEWESGFDLLEAELNALRDLSSIGSRPDTADSNTVTPAI